MSRFVPQTWQQLIPRWGIEGLTARVAETGRTGWYCRVMQEGMVEPGMFVTLIERPYCFN